LTHKRVNFFQGKTQEEIDEAKQKAMLQIQREQREKLRKPTTPKKVTAQPAQQTSLFDF
jgi:hypothetical protein